MKKIKLISVAILALTVITFFIAPVLNDYYWRFREFVEPGLVETYVNSFEDKPSEYLVEVYRGKNRPLVVAAARVLKKRKDDYVVDQMIEIVENSKNQNLKSGAINILSSIGDVRSVPILVKIVESGRNNPQYLNALDALSIMRYDKIYPEILKMAQDGYHISWVVDMLARFPDKPETLSTLQNIAKEDPEWYIREKAKEAISKIR